MATKTLASSVGIVPNNTVPSGSRLTHALADGRLLVCVPHASNGNVEVYEVSADRATSTLRATVPTENNSVVRVSTAMFPDNSLAIMWRSGDQMKISYKKVTFGTWAISAVETAMSVASPAMIETFDADVSDAGVVYVVAIHYNGSNTVACRLAVRHTGNAWATPLINQHVVSGSAIRRGAVSCSVIALDAAAGVRNIILAISGGRTVVDTGVIVSSMRITEASGGVALAYDQRHALMSGESSLSSWIGARNVSLFRIGPSEAALAISHTDKAKKNGVATFSWAGTTWGVTRQLQLFTGVAGQVAFSATPSTVTFHFWRWGTAAGTSQDEIYVAKLDSVITFSPNLIFGKVTGDRVGVGGMGTRNLAASKNDILARAYQQSKNYAFASTLVYSKGSNRPDGSSAIVALIPRQGDQVSDANPTLTSVIDTEQAYSESEYKIEYALATDASFTTNVISYVQPDSFYKQVKGTDVPGVIESIIDRLPNSYTLVGSPWYIRARLIDRWGSVGAWTATNQFTLIHPPIASPLSPAGGQMYLWNGGLVNLDWSFTDPSLTDYQTAYQVQVALASGVILLDTGKLASASKRHVANLAGANKDRDLYWTVRVWDSQDTPSAWSKQSFFYLTDPPAAQIVYPVPNQVVDTGVPTITTTLTSGGGRAIKEYTISVLQNGKVVWSQRVAGPFASGTSVNNKIPQGFLSNNQSYSVMVTATDSSDLLGVSPLVPFSVAWVPPAAPSNVTVSVAPYNTEDQGYVLLSWDDLTRDPDFVSYVVYRKSDMMDPLTGQVVEEGQYELAAEIHETNALYEYRDFFAPSGYRISYLVKQAINRYGQDMDSANSVPVQAFPQSDGYWLIEPNSDDSNADAFKLHSVTADSFTEEQEEAEIVVMGRGRVFNKGEVLGVKGTLECQLRNTGGVSARYKRMRLKKIQEVETDLYLRNPFGDCFKVNVSQMSISRIAGVGLSEFCDVTIPYSEVG